MQYNYFAALFAYHLPLRQAVFNFFLCIKYVINSADLFLFSFLSL
jgi:hypothetical protein